MQFYLLNLLNLFASIRILIYRNSLDMEPILSIIIELQCNINYLVLFIIDTVNLSSTFERKKYIYIFKNFREWEQTKDQ